jgi:hypothetical protein
MEVQRAGVPPTRLIAGDPGTLSRSFVLLVNRPGEEPARAGADPVGLAAKVNQKVATARQGAVALRGGRSLPRGGECGKRRFEGLLVILRHA